MVRKPVTENMKEEDVKEIIDIYGFLNVVRWVPTVGQTNGTSWLELLYLYQHYGGKLPSQHREEENPLGTMAGIRLTLLRFRRKVMQVVGMYTSAEDQMLFRPSRAAQPRLMGYGIKAYVPCIMAETCFNKEAGEGLRDAMVDLAIGQVRRRMEKQ